MSRKFSLIAAMLSVMALSACTTLPQSATCPAFPKPPANLMTPPAALQTLKPSPPSPKTTGPITSAPTG